MLASQSTETVTAYLENTKLQKITSTTIVDKGQLLKRIDNINRDGYEITIDELEEGMVSMAVPVMDNEQNTVAAMSMSASSARISIKQLRKDYLPILQTHAFELSQCL